MPTWGEQLAPIVEKHVSSVTDDEVKVLRHAAECGALTDEQRETYGHLIGEVAEPAPEPKPRRSKRT